MKIIKEDGGAVMAAGTGGFTNAAPAAGPVAGFDPVMKMKKNFKDRTKKFLKRAKPPYNVNGLVSDNL